MHFFIHGLNKNSHLYHRGLESIKTTVASHLYQGEAVLLNALDVGGQKVPFGQGEYNQYLIDHAVQVIARNPKQCAPQIDYWKSKRTEVILKGGTSAVVLGGVALLAGPMVGVGLGVSAVGMALFSGYRAYEANNQANLWDGNLLQVAIEDRKRAADFEYAYTKNLKESVVHPDEIRASWKKAADKKISEAPHHLSATDVENFFSKNPLQMKRRSYAAIELDPSLVSNYDKIENRFHNINQMIDSRKQKIQGEANFASSKNLQNQEKELAIYKQLFELTCRGPLNEKEKSDNQVKEMPIDTPEQRKEQQRLFRENQKTYEQAIVPFQIIYNIVTQPIVDKFQTKEREIRFYRDQFFARAEEDRKNHLSGMSNNVKKICDLYSGKEDNIITVAELADENFIETIPMAEAVVVKEPSIEQVFSQVETLPTAPSITKEQVKQFFTR